MAALRDASRDLNELAHAVVEELDAGAVVILALIQDDDGEAAVAIGSTGLPHTMRIVAEAMPMVAPHLLEASATAGEGGRVEKEAIFRMPDNEN